MRTFVLVGVIASIAGCGSRSELLVGAASDPGHGGSGNVGATNGSGSSGGFDTGASSASSGSSSSTGGGAATSSSGSASTTSGAGGGDGGSGAGGGAGGSGGSGGAGGCDGACSCPSGTHACGDVCADDLSTATCGTRCSPCPIPPHGNGLTSCDGNGCHFGCDPSFTNCNGGCIQVEADPGNCGYCGHDCLGGACIAGGCQPVVLLSGQPLVRFIAVDDDSLYFTTAANGDSMVDKMPLAGGAIQTIVSGAVAPNGIAVDDSFLYFADVQTSGQVRRVAKQGGTPTTLTSNVPGAFGIAIGPQTLCFSQIYVALISCMSIDGGTPTLLYAPPPQGGATGVAMDAQNLYFGTYGSVGSYPFAGGTATTIADQQNDAISVAIDDQYIYWSTLYGGNVERIAKLGGLPTTIISGLGIYGDGIAVDAKAVYFATSDSNNISTIVRLAK